MIVIFAGTKPALKLEKGGTTFSSFNQHPSLPFVATDDRPLSPSSHFAPRDEKSFVFAQLASFSLPARLTVQKQSFL